ncbi:hypothetical protein ABG768_001620 [Culter alburnus]|uniref:Immunoglobulin domain-containing protein n=1 Tax=Culter alburnus TaxID=194366 RepID=A0AAW2A1K6_CULAL
MGVLFIFLLAGSFLLYQGTSGVDTEGVSVKEGDSVTLHTGVQKTQQSSMKWYFNTTRIAQINGIKSKSCTDVQCNEGTEKFRGRLKLDHQTGSLTIMNITNLDDGEYKLKISSYIEKIFSVSVHDVSAAERDEMKRKVKEGESVTLDTGVVKIHHIIWAFHDTLIAEITGNQSKICTDVQCNEVNERFRDRLKLDHQTGSLTIMNTRNTDSGEYTLKIISSSSSLRRRRSISVSSVKSFDVTVIGSGRSSGFAAGISVAVLLVCVAAVAAVIYRRRRNFRNGKHGRT